MMPFAGHILNAGHLAQLAANAIGHKVMIVLPREYEASLCRSRPGSIPSLFQRHMSLSGHSWRMIVTLNTQSLSSLAEVRAFLDGSTAVYFSPPAEAGRYGWLNRTLRQLSEVLMPYLNYHRPCFFPETTLNAKGRQRRRYRYEHMNTPYERLKSLPEAADTLKPGLTFTELDAVAMTMTDNQAAERLNREREKLFQRIRHTKAA